MGIMPMTFYQRWPLAGDRSGHWSFTIESALRKMRRLPEILALLSRHGSGDEI